MLVDGDDLNEPVTDTVRGILDGHIILSRKLANQNHYPAIDVLASISRLMPSIISKEHLKNANIIKDIMAVYKESEDLINIGAYKMGSNKKLDLAISMIDDIEEFLIQETSVNYSFDETYKMLLSIIEKAKEHE